MGDDTILGELLVLAAMLLATRINGEGINRRTHATRLPRPAAKLGSVTRNLGAIDGELRLIAALRRSARLRGGPLPANDRINALLDERLATVSVRRVRARQPAYAR